MPKVVICCHYNSGRFIAEVDSGSSKVLLFDVLYLGKWSGIMAHLSLHFSSLYSGSGIWWVICECSAVCFGRLWLVFTQPNEVKFFSRQCFLLFLCPPALPTVCLHFQCCFLSLWILTSKRVEERQRYRGCTSPTNQLTPASPVRKGGKRQGGRGRGRKKEVREGSREREEASSIVLRRLYYCSTTFVPPLCKLWSVPMFLVHFVGMS